MPHFLRIVITVFLLVGLSGCNDTQTTRKISSLAIIVNEADPISIKIADYYRQKRSIPNNSVIKVKFNPNNPVISPKQFKAIQAQVEAKTPSHIQNYGLTWVSPYRVGCMSITSAFAFGFDPSHCAKGCHPTKENPYFNSKRSQPYTDFGIRPTMAIAAKTFEEAKRLIDRGVAADGTYPQGTAYLLDTKDKNRNVRASFYPKIDQTFEGRFPLEVIKANTLKDKTDVMFYFTGLVKVKEIETNRFRPGAIADHLTSFGGQLTDSHQMSSLRWLEAGATGSYGTVVEPCNFPQKFPHPGLVMYHYLGGDSLINAYWKSVAWVGQGLFIGEPLARPFGFSSP